MLFACARWTPVAVVGFRSDDFYRRWCEHGTQTTSSRAPEPAAGRPRRAYPALRGSWFVVRGSW